MDREESMRQIMTATEALKSPATRKLVHEVLALCETRDIVDAIHDLEHATAVLKERLNHLHSRIERAQEAK